MKTLTGSKCHFVYLSFTGMLVNNSKPTVGPNLETNHFRDYRMATNFNFIKTKFNQRPLRNQRAK